MPYRSTISGLTPGTYGFRFKTADDTGRFGDWSPVFQYTVVGDITPPPTTSKPVVESVLGGVFVKWVESSYAQPVDFNRVDVYVSTGGSYTKFGSIAAIGAGITYTPITGTGPFTFKFTGVDRSGNVSAFSEASDAVSSGSLNIDTDPPAVPGGLNVVAANDSADPSGDSGYVDVSWIASSSSDLLGYYIRYGRSSSVWDEYLFMQKGQTTKRIHGLRSGVTYYFQINSTDGSNPSVYIPTIPVSVTIPADTAAPSSPSGLIAVAGFNNVIAYWNRNSEKDVDLGRGAYEFQLSTSNTFSSILQSRTITGTVATFTGLITDQIYYVRVRAIDSSGNFSNWSSVVSATPGKISGNASISNGTIVGDLIAGNTIVGDKLIANTIDADRLKTNTGILGKLFVGDESATNKVVIDGTSAIPSLYQGLGSYNNTNTGFYLDGAGKFSLKDSLSWDNSTLTVKGSLNVSQASTFTGNVTLNSGGDIILNGGAIRATGSAGRVEIGSLGVYGYNATSGGTPQVRIDANTGQIIAIGGTIGGWTLGPSSLTTTNSNGQVVGLYSNGQLNMGPNFSVAANGAATFSGTVTIVGTGSNVPLTTDVNNALATKVGSSDVKSHLGGTNVTTISGGIISTGTINLNNVNVNNTDGTTSAVKLSSNGLEIWNSSGVRTVWLNRSGAAEFVGEIKSGSKITGTEIVGGSMSIGAEESPDFVKTNYTRNGITGLGFNAVAMQSIRFAGWTSSQYPYTESINSDLGIPYQSTFFQPFRFRNLRLNGSIILTNDSNGLDADAVTRIFSSGRIFANTLNEGASFTGTANIGQVSGFLRVVSSSTIRVKDNIMDIEKSPEVNPELLLSIPVRSFKYKLSNISNEDERYDKVLPGFIAEEVDQIYPVAVDHDEDGQPARWNSFFMIPGMLSLIQKQHDEILRIKSRLDALEG
jgi:chitodextrinase